jgi:hypothetical protein
MDIVSQNIFKKNNMKKKNKYDKYIYTKEDLLWEATRRNELYRAEFQDVIEDPETYLIMEVGCSIYYANEHTRIQNLIRKKRIFPAFSERWGIEFHNPYESVEDIVHKISVSEYEKESHPYYYWYRNKDIPVQEHRLPENKPISLKEIALRKYINYKEFTNVQSDYSGALLIISRNSVKERLVISINPDSNMELINKDLKK